MENKFPPAKISVHAEEYKRLVQKHGKNMDASLRKQDILPKGSFASEIIVYYIFNLRSG